MATITWAADKLQTGEHAPPHFRQVRNLLESAPGNTYLFPDDFGGQNATPAQVALRGTLDDRPNSRAVKFAMTTIESDLADDTSKMGQ